MKFSEIQRIPRGFSYTILIIMILVDSLAVTIAPPSEKLVAMIVTMLPLILVSVLLIAVSMETKIENNQLSIKTLFFIKSTIPLNNIISSEVITYRPLRDFGGFGVRYAQGGVMYNMHGKQAVKLTLKDNKIIYIGTQKPQDLLQSIGK